MNKNVIMTGLAVGLLYLFSKGTAPRNNRLPTSSEVGNLFSPESIKSTFSPYENLPAVQLAAIQGKTLKRFYQDAAFGTMEVDRQNRVSTLRTGVGRNVQLEVTIPMDRLQERSGVKIPNPLTGKMEDSRQVFLQGLRPTGLKPSTQQAGTLSKQSTRNTTGSVRKSSLRGSV